MFQYVYGAVSPMQGELDWMITDKMNTANMSGFSMRDLVRASGGLYAPPKRFRNW